jgi:hypothetical protein
VSEPGRIPTPEALEREGWNTAAAGWLEQELARVQLERQELINQLKYAIREYEKISGPGPDDVCHTTWDLLAKLEPDWKP